MCFLISSLHLQRTEPAHQPVPNVDTRLDFPSVVLLVLAGRRPLAVTQRTPSANMYDSAAAKALRLKLLKPLPVVDAAGCRFR